MKNKYFTMPQLVSSSVSSYPLSFFYLFTKQLRTSQPQLFDRSIYGPTSGAWFSGLTLLSAYLGSDWDSL